MPPYSCDIMPIEYVFNIIKRKLNYKNYSTITELIEKLNQVNQKIKKKSIINCINYCKSLYYKVLKWPDLW